MSLMLFRGCASLILGGVTIGAPAYFLSKWSGSPLATHSTTRNTRTPLYTLSGQPARETVTVSQEQLRQEQQFDDCLKGNKLDSKVTRIGQPSETKIVPIGEIEKYLKDPEWKVESLYENQCKKADQ